MSDDATFTHEFGGWLKSDARRWRNPDGSEGGVVATSASVHKSANIPASVEVWPNAKIFESVSIGDGSIIGDGSSIGYGSIIGDGVEFEKDDWIFVAGPQGSRNAWATTVWSPKHGLRWWVGCQHGITTETLRESVEHDHGSSAHGDDYRHLIAMVEAHPGLARAIGSASE